MLSKYLKFIPWIIIIVLFSGCGARWHLNQSKRHKLKAIQLGAIITTDTVFKDRTIITKEVKTDTLFKDVIGDTVYITKNNLKIKYVRMLGDTVFIEGKAERDTLIIRTPITVTEVVHAPEPKFKWWMFILCGFAIGIVLALLLKK